MSRTTIEQKLHEFPLGAAEEGHRVGETLAKLLPALSSRQRVMAVNNGLVTLGGATVTNLDTVIAADSVSLIVDLRHGVRGEGRPSRPRLEEQIRVLHDDEDCVVVSKAAGIIVQPAPDEKAGAHPPVVELLKHYWKSRRESQGVNPVLIQRLDKETSGLMVLAKNVPAGRNLQRQASGRSMERRYLALVHGTVEGESGTWQDVLGVGEDGLRQRVGASVEEFRGKLPHGASEAITRWKVVQRVKWATLLELKLETGRTHQIRIHCAEAGHPVVGDRVYIKLAGKRFPRLKFGGPDFPRPGRMMLHAERLKFQHPAKETRWLTFRDDLPESFRVFVSSLENPASPEVGEAATKAKGKRRARAPK